MVRFMGLSLVECRQRLLSEPLVFIKTVLIYLWMKLLKPKHRLHLYDARDLETTHRGPFILPIEKKVEEPLVFKDQNIVDSVLVFGVNSTGDRLLARVSREREGHVHWLHLELSDGRTYQPVSSHKVFPPSDTHSAGGLRIKCLVPMLRWRISYNGILRETKSGTEESSAVHVQFSFLCISTATPLDLIQGLPSPILAELLARTSRFRWPPDQKDLINHVDRFVQPANFVGTIKIEDDSEQEINLWGVRQRTKDNLSWNKGSVSSLREVIGYTEDGQIIYSGEYHLPSFKQKLVFGIHLERCSHFWPVKSCSIDFGRSEKPFEGAEINILSEHSMLTATVHVPDFSMSGRAGVNTGFTAHAHTTALQTEDGDRGSTITVDYEWKYENDESSETETAWILPRLDVATMSKPAFVLTLSDNLCKLPSLTGGKGSSLANLTYLAKTYPTNFVVPTGFVVTTTAYKEFFSTAGVKPIFSSFEEKVWCSDYETLKASCELLVENISKLKLTPTIQKAVLHAIQKEFPGGVTGKRFAVRSSASGEDSEDMSAAGQMSTFLGITEIHKIFESIVKCWASQFSFPAIQYKRQNGQELNSMMAVVVQEMVSADSAGVLFTCDPISGNPKNVNITANYGLGESVVSASAEPDTIVLFRDEPNQLTLKSVQIGEKNLKMMMTAEGNVVEAHVDEDNKTVCCISNECALKLGRTSLKIEEAYGVPLDIEWAYSNNQLYMLQARPVTTFERETKCELLHAVDDSIRTENDYWTSANTGDVMPTAGSHLGITIFTQAIAMGSQYCYSGRNPYSFPMTPFSKPLFSAFNFAVMSISNFVLRFHQNGTKSFLSEAGLVAGFGRILDDQEMYDQVDRRNKTYPTTFVPYQVLLFIYDILFAPRILEKSFERFKKESLDLRNCSSSKEMFSKIWKNFNDTLYAITIHFTTSVNSTLYNNVVMSILRSTTKEWNAQLFSDFSSVLTSCGNFESADVPESINRLAHVIKLQNDADDFKKMNPEDALKWLETTRTSAGDEFKKFMERHGHRGLMEFDVYRKPWRINKLPLIKALQDSVDIPYEEKRFIPASEVIKKMKAPLSWTQKFVLKFMIPLCRKSVLIREKSKSLYVKFFDHHRRSFSVLGDQMVKEGRLPEKELLYFLSIYEVLQLVENRNPTLLQRAVRRRALFPELNHIRLPEIAKGVPKPTNVKEMKNYDDLPADIEVKGTPVSQGIVEGYARVALTVEEAALIKRGEILIAHSTDVGWSPYFPLLGGVVTEIGGLISHGAVVAREYGLPCVLGVRDSTFMFKTGDYVVLDGNKGVLKRIPVPSGENNLS